MSENKSNSKAAKEKQTAQDWLEEYVTVELFKDSDRYREDVFLQIGNENCLIQRGVPVQIKRKFALLLEQTRRQEKAAADTKNSMPGWKGN